MALFPNHNALQECFTQTSPFVSRPAQSNPVNRHPRDAFQTWSAADDVKGKASQLSVEAQREYSKASGVAQAKANKIELYSGKYYAACIAGGVVACVRTH